MRREIYIATNGFNTNHKEKNIELSGDYLLLLELFLIYNIASIHISRFVIIYEGGGASTDLTTLNQRLEYERKVKRDLFGATKFYLYQLIFSVENYFKKILYDKFFHILANKINQNRSNKTIK